MLRRAWQCLGGGSLARAAIRSAIVLAAVGIGALLFVAAGLVPVAASAGHWPVTRMLLHFAMRRSVATHSVGIEVPSLDDPDMVLKGAGHYATNCMPCHGAPGHPRPLLVRQMVPEPPYLPPIARDFDPAERFWVVKHGIKYTAMPAWPSQQRDDEVWAMVAFLQRLPEMGPARFRQLAYGEDSTLADAIGTTLATLETPMSSTLANCARCHGADGGGRGAIPRLAGQREAYLLASLQAYARGDRHSGIMQPVAAALEPADMIDLARHYAGLDSPPPASAADHPDPGVIERGARLATRGDAARRVPACVECHGSGNSSDTAATPRNPHYPLLAGQHVGYLELQLTLFTDGTRGGSAYAPIMHTVAGSLEPRDIRDLAVYFGSLPAAPDSPAQ